MLPEWIRGGLEALPDILDRAVYDQMQQLIDHPQPILEALDRYPFTLVHADYRAENLGYDDGRLVVIDWQSAARSLMIVDLAWITKHGYVQKVMSVDAAIRYYRKCLETHLKVRFNHADWQAMVDLGYAVDALRSSCLFAYFYSLNENPESRDFNEKLVKQQGQMVMDALRWL